MLLYKGARRDGTRSVRRDDQSRFIEALGSRMRMKSEA